MATAQQEDGVTALCYIEFDGFNFRVPVVGDKEPLGFDRLMIALSKSSLANLLVSEDPYIFEIYDEPFGGFVVADHNTTIQNMAKLRIRSGTLPGLLPRSVKPVDNGAAAIATDSDTPPAVNVSNGKSPSAFVPKQQQPSTSTTPSSNGYQLHHFTNKPYYQGPYLKPAASTPQSNGKQKSPFTYKPYNQGSAFKPATQPLYQRKIKFSPNNRAFDHEIQKARNESTSSANGNDPDAARLHSFLENPPPNQPDHLVATVLRALVTLANKSVKDEDNFNVDKFWDYFKVQAPLLEGVNPDLATIKFFKKLLKRQMKIYKAVLEECSTESAALAAGWPHWRVVHQELFRPGLIASLLHWGDDTKEEYTELRRKFIAKASKSTISPAVLQVPKPSNSSNQSTSPSMDPLAMKMKALGLKVTNQPMNKTHKKVTIAKNLTVQQLSRDESNSPSGFTSDTSTVDSSTANESDGKEPNGSFVPAYSPELSNLIAQQNTGDAKMLQRTNTLLSIVESGMATWAHYTTDESFWTNVAILMFNAGMNPRKMDAVESIRTQVIHMIILYVKLMSECSSVVEATQLWPFFTKCHSIFDPNFINKTINDEVRPMYQCLKDGELARVRQRFEKRCLQDQFNASATSLLDPLSYIAGPNVSGSGSGNKSVSTPNRGNHSSSRHNFEELGESDRILEASLPHSFNGSRLVLEEGL